MSSHEHCIHLDHTDVGYCCECRQHYKPEKLKQPIKLPTVTFEKASTLVQAEKIGEDTHVPERKAWCEHCARLMPEIHKCLPIEITLTAEETRAWIQHKREAEAVRRIAESEKNLGLNMK